MNRTIEVKFEESRSTRTKDFLLGLAVVAAIVLGLIVVAKVSIDGTMEHLSNKALIPLREVTLKLEEGEERLYRKDREYVTVLDEDDLYEGWGKASVRTYLLTYPKEELGQITIEALWSEEAAVSRSEFIKDHPNKRWFEPWIDEKQYELKSVYSCGRFCIRFSREVNAKDENRIMNKIGSVIRKEKQRIS